MVARLLLVLSFTTFLAAQPADLTVRIDAGPYDDQRIAEVVVEVVTHTPLADPEEITLDLVTITTLDIEEWSAGPGLDCTQESKGWLKCTVAPAAAGARTSVSMRVTPRTIPGVGLLNATLAWRERGHRPERRTWRKNVFDYAKELVVTHTGDSGPDSLRQGILDANANCNQYFRPCLLRFELPPSSVIRPLTPLPAITAQYLTIESQWPLTLDGSLLTVPANGLTVASPASEIFIMGLTIHSFPENGIEITGFATIRVESCVITGNRSRGVTILGGVVFIDGNVISGNGRSGVFITGGTSTIVRNLIGVAVDGVTAMPNGASGVFAGGQAYAYIAENVIANNAHFGVGTHRANRQVDVGPNRIVGNRGAAIDVDLDGPSFFTDLSGQLSAPNGPVLHSATYDPATNRTTIRGRLETTQFYFYLTYDLQFYATTAANEADQYLGAIHITRPDFTFTVAGDLRGRFVTANTIRFVHAEITFRGTSELSTPIEVREQ